MRFSLPDRCRVIFSTRFRSKTAAPGPKTPPLLSLSSPRRWAPATSSWSKARTDRNCTLSPLASNPASPRPRSKRSRLDMLTWLSDLSHFFSPFNVFRYITFRAAGASATALAFVFFFGPDIIASLRLKQGKGQPIRSDGPQSHLAKKGTPTMGGLMILSGLIVSTVLWANPRSAYVWITLFVTVGFGAIGFYDDYLKVTKQSHKGFSGRARLFGEAAIGVVAAYFMMCASATGPVTSVGELFQALVAPFY